ncbi:hypothetical protein EMPS_07903 [Entomortierella parvispora]|uniref:Uncharacterized protein n=1 Tax=Entomortierella parvispora TaxID=205924 RepID=A0A9P3HFD0_9FUNG|nr:hypothetical protein EMPS_07903 [Entomortierella parvispora]
MEVQAASAPMMAISSSPSSSSSLKTKASSSHNKALAITTSPKAINPENDPNPSWTFFPPSATYIPHSPYLSSSSPTGVQIPSPASGASPSVAPSINNNNNGSRIQSNNNAGNNLPSSTPSTHHRILDHCFHLSIETRLKQAEAQYLASTQEQAVEQQIQEQQALHQPPMSAFKQDDWRRRQRSLVDEAVVLGRKGSNVEAIVDGILKSHRSSGPLQTLPMHLKHRLHLCQLTSMVFGRFDVASSTNNSAGLNIYSAFQSSRHEASCAVIQYHLAHSPQGQKTRELFVEPVKCSFTYCRRHHRKDCQRTCCTLAKMQKEQQQALELKKKMSNTYYMNNTRKPEQQRVAGLTDAIPAFLKCSAMSYRDIAKCMVERGEQKDVKDTKISEGWYRLLLEMLTQAVIESYLCDGTAGVDTILDIFSYGDDPEIEELQDGATSAAGSSPAIKSSRELSPTARRPSAGNAVNTMDDTQPQGGRRSSIKGQSQISQQHQQSPAPQDSNAQDRQDDILFVKTPEYIAFKNAKTERLQEFLTLNGASVEQHFVALANKYPVIVFERQMTHYIARSQKLLADPKLSRNTEDIGLLMPPTTSAYADGSLSMPVSDDEDDVMEEINRLEKIKEEDEVDECRPIVVESPPSHHQRQPQKHSRHEKMKLATITLSMDDELPNQAQHHHHPFAAPNVYGAPGYHLPSPPHSVAASRSSTVSPNSSSSSTGSLSEEEESIAEAARILMSSNLKSMSIGHIKSDGSHADSRKHKYHDEPSSTHPYGHASVKIEPSETEDKAKKAALRRPVKKMKV